MEFDKKTCPCPIVNVDGVLASGKQFDLDITLPEDNRDVIYGVVKDCYGEPACNAVVKLVEVCYCHGVPERRPVSHTFTDKAGEFVFGPLCPNKIYEVVIWVDEVKHVKICADCKHTGPCLKGLDISDCDFHLECDNTCGHYQGHHDDCCEKPVCMPSCKPEDCCEEICKPDPCCKKDCKKSGR